MPLLVTSCVLRPFLRVLIFGAFVLGCLMGAHCGLLVVLVLVCSACCSCLVCLRACPLLGVRRGKKRKARTMKHT